MALSVIASFEANALFSHRADLQKCVGFALLLLRCRNCEDFLKLESVG